MAQSELTMIIDYNNFVMRSLFTCQFMDPDVKINNFNTQSEIDTLIRKITMDICYIVRLFTPKRIILSCDSKSPWRKDLYKDIDGMEYKGTREKDSDKNWDIRIKKQGDENEYIHSVYVYDFGNNVAYIGRTMDPINRDRRHRIPQQSHGKNIIGCVLKYSMESGIEIPKMKLLETDLNMQESCRQEDFWLNEYKNRGYTMLNTGSTGEFVGSIGCFTVKWTREKAIEYAKQFDSLAALYKSNQYMPKLLKKLNLLDELFPNRLRAHKMTFDEVKDVASKYPTRTRLQKSEQKYYYVARKNGWLNLLFPPKYE